MSAGLGLTQVIFVTVLYSLNILRMKLFAVEPDFLIHNIYFTNSRHFLTECMLRQIFQS